MSIKFGTNQGPGEIITEMQKFGEVIEKIFSSRTTQPEELIFT
jgi:hypothetical protein